MADAASGRPIVVGIVAPPGVARERAEELAATLPADLNERFPGVEWRAEVADADPVPSTANARELVEAVRRRLLWEGWDLAVGLTDLPLRAGRRPVTAHASASHGVGLVSLPALGAVGLTRRLRSAVVHLIEGMLGESVGPRGEARGRDARLAGRLRELGSPLGRAHVQDDGTVGFVGATLRGNLRLLVGMVRANEPSRIIVRLSRALLGSLGTAAVAVVTRDFWALADAMSWPRLAVLAVIAVLGTVLALMLAHGLWERAPSRQARERVVLFNLATTITVTLGVLTLYGGLFVLSLAGGLALIPPRLFEHTTGHSVGIVDYLRLACTIAALATLGGALGSLVESDDAVRDAAYRTQDDARTETGG
jgi:uncharacterized membrane protein